MAERPPAERSEALGKSEEPNRDAYWRPIDEVLRAIVEMCPACWCTSVRLKYLELRIDTRDFGTTLYAAHGMGGAARTAITAEELRRAVAKCREIGMHSLEPNGLATLIEHAPTEGKAK